MDVAKLLERHSDEEPSGENLEYDADFMAMEIAAQPGQERQAGSQIIAAEEPDHGAIRGMAMGILGRAHDIRAAVILALSDLNVRGLVGLAESVSYVKGCLTEWWDTCHPQLDADDDNDPTMRISAVRGLGSDRMIAALRRAPLTESRTFGRITLRDLMVNNGEYQLAPGSDPVPDKATVRAAFEDTALERKQANLALVRGILADLKAIDRMFSDKTPGFGPDLDDIRKNVQTLARLMGDYVAEPAQVMAEDETTAVEPGQMVTPAEMTAAYQEAPRAAPAAPQAPGAVAPGQIATRADVEKALDAIMAYYRHIEPSSPIPILLRRAKRLVQADFMTILRDLAPGGVDSVAMLGGGAEEG